MEITEVRVRLVKNRDDRLKAFCSMTFDNEFVVRDIKVIAGPDGHFIAMPSRRMSDHCGRCGGKNTLGARYCSGCGHLMSAHRIPKDPKGRVKLHADIAHPINPACRLRIQQKLITAYEAELERSKQPGYRLVEIDELDTEASDAL